MSRIYKRQLFGLPYLSLRLVSCAFPSILDLAVFPSTIAVASDVAADRLIVATAFSALNKGRKEGKKERRERKGGDKQR